MPALPGYAEHMSVLGRRELAAEVAPPAFIPTADGRVIITHMAGGPVDTATAALYARWLNTAAMAAPCPIFKAKVLQAASDCLAVVRIAQNLRGARRLADPTILNHGRPA